MTRLLLLSLTILLLAACSRPPGKVEMPVGEPAREVFLNGLDEMLATGTSPALKSLTQINSSDPWKARAQGLLKLQAEAKRDLRSKTAEQQQQIHQCREANEKFARENDALNHDLQELKRIMVEMEKRNK